ncbi:uncharacterized mitochondrial protein AtMg00810-like [Rhododendron vialii]|uniref:uncharacterized mitochondrial protein AtMg00810-like n=1 Tax=Rhododendron vialii TaxID=182163 RepID=UPI00265F921D|nr:uncharacterized mitochondrial protein AtMg00810-like [Rhododendron vialii]
MKIFPTFCFPQISLAWFLHGFSEANRTNASFEPLQHSVYEPVQQFKRDPVLLVTTFVTEKSLFGDNMTSTVILVVLVYVDDILITGNAHSFITQLVHQMQNAFSRKDLSSVSYFLGISIQSKGAGYLLSQCKYACDILAKAGMVNCKPCASPISITPSHSSIDSLPFSQPTLYRSIVGALQYLTITRPDLAYAVNHACQHMVAPTVAHFTAVKRLLRSVQGTLDHGLFFSPGPFTLQAYFDSDWAGDALDCRSTSGFCIFLGHNLISWSAKKQPTVSRSSTEAEYRALAHTVAELSWLQMLLRDFSIVLHSLPVLWCDNLGALALASNPVFHARSKHIAIDYHFIREKVTAK